MIRTKAEAEAERERERERERGRGTHSLTHSLTDVTEMAEN